MTWQLVLALTALAIWAYMVLAHGGYWRADQREAMQENGQSTNKNWPAVVAIVPARDEADMLPLTLPTLLAQDYPGSFAIVLVDDQSSDRTGDVARKLAQGARFPVEVVRAAERPAGWTGKVWAQSQGVAHVSQSRRPCTLFLLTDADIAYEAQSLRHLVTLAQEKHAVLTSLMARLNCESVAERTLVPAFVYFFQMLYPFRWVNTPSNPMAAAAGGCMLIDRQALERAGGMAAIRSALIDDCTLGQMMKRHGPVWLGLAKTVRSVRPYPHWGDIRRMVARSAYAQLRYSPLLLAGTVFGMVLTYLSAPALALLGAYPANLIGGVTWALMAVSYQPMLRYYGTSPLWGLALPVIAAIYLAFTLDSAYQHWRGRGGMWKGRAQAAADRPSADRA